MSGPCPCGPREIFELTDGALGPERAREIQAHLEACPGCRELYERELELNAVLHTMELAEPRSVCRGVAMALPTRPLRARLLWAALALALLLAASLALSLDGIHPAVLAVNALDLFWGVVSGFADMALTLLIAAGPLLLLALVVGALLDLLLAAVLLWTTRRRTRAA